ncbi:MAG: hypothetical protein QXU18_09265 [Thermoplasmatales archaeon]
MSEKYIVKHKKQIVIESFIATNTAELCGWHGVSFAQFHRCNDLFH